MPDAPITNAELVTDVATAASSSSNSLSEQRITIKQILLHLETILTLISPRPAQKVALGHRSTSGDDRDKANDEKRLLQVMQKRDYLFTAVSDAYGQAGRVLLDKVLLVDEQTPPYEAQGDYDRFYNHTLYAQVLPLCQLAYCEEQNGIAEQHAFKLSLFFDDLVTIVRYLKAFSEEMKVGYPVHDACLFDLPPIKADFVGWRRLSQAKGAQGKINLLNPRFKELLPHADKLETLMQTEGQISVYKRQINETKVKLRKDKTLKDRLKAEKQELKRCYQELNIKEKELATLRKDYRRLSKHPIINPTEEQKAERINKLSELRRNQILLCFQLVNLAQGLDLKDANVGILSAFYEKYLHDANPGHRILIHHGISEENIALLYSLERKNSDAVIPNLMIDGAILGYPGYYLTKLDTLSDEGAAIAACLGKITECCQYLGGLGADCAIHGISSELGGFYVLWKGNPEEPRKEDELIAQAWVWRAKSDALCFDSIEAMPFMRHEKAVNIIADMYRALAIELCSGNYQISQVNTGAQSGITQHIALEDFPTKRLEVQDFHGYNDSKSQLYLADSALPYLFFNKCASTQLNALIEQKTEQLFEDLLCQEVPLEDNEAIKQAIAFGLYFENEPLLELLSTKVGLSRKDELDHLIHVNKAWIAALDKRVIELTYLNDGAYINARSIKSGRSALHLATLAKDVELVKQLVTAGAHLDVQDMLGNTPLLDALEKVLYSKGHMSGKEIAIYLVSKGAGVDIKDDDECTALITAVKNNDLEMVQVLVEAGADIDTYDDEMRTALYWAAEKGLSDIFNYLYEKNASVNVVSYTHGNSLLMVAANFGNSEMVAKIIARGNVNFKHKNEEGSTALFKVNNPESFKLILNCYPKSEQRIAINTLNNTGSAPLHIAIHFERYQMIECLLAHGADVNLLANNGTSSVFMAVHRRNTALVEYLIDAGAHIERATSEQKACVPWQQAIKNRHFDSIALLLSKKFIHPKDFDIFLVYLAEIALNYFNIRNEQYFSLIRRLDNVHKVKVLTHFNSSSVNAFLRAIEQGYSELVGGFLSVIVTLDPAEQIRIWTLTNRYNEGIICLAKKRISEVLNLLLDYIQPLSPAQQAQILMVSLIEHKNMESNIERINVTDSEQLHANCEWIYNLANERINIALVEKGVDINLAETRRGYSALHLATQQNDLVLIQKLVQSGIDLEIKDNMGRTALMIAVQNKQFTIVRLLVESGADIETVDNRHKTPLYRAAELMTRTDDDTENDAGEGIFNFLYDQNANVDVIPSSKSKSILMLFSGYGNAMMVAKIIARGNVNYRFKNICGETALFLARDLRCLELILGCYPESEQRIVINECDQHGQTLLLNAIENRNPEEVSYLITHGADINQLTPRGFHPLVFAIWTGLPRIVNCFLDQDSIDLSAVKWMSPLAAAMNYKFFNIAASLMRRGCYMENDKFDFFIYAPWQLIPVEMIELYYTWFITFTCPEKKRILTQPSPNYSLLELAIADRQFSCDRRFSCFLSAFGELPPVQQENILLQPNKLRQTPIMYALITNPIIVERLLSKLSFNSQKNVLLATINELVKHNNLSSLKILLCSSYEKRSGCSFYTLSLIKTFNREEKREVIHCINQAIFLSPPIQFKKKEDDAAKAKLREAIREISESMLSQHSLFPPNAESAPSVSKGSAASVSTESISIS